MGKSRGSYLLVVTPLIVGIVGCSDDKAEEDFCAKLATAGCSWARQCCELDELRSVLGLPSQDAYTVELLRTAQREQDKCKDLLHSACVAQQRTLLDSWGSQRVTLNEEQLTGCLEQFDLAASSCDIGLQTGPAITEACNLSKLFTGNAAAGDACFHPLDCGGATFCWRPGSASGPGICKPVVAEGQACRNSTKCEDNRVCAPLETRTSWCTPMDRQADGAFCTDDALCAPGLFCNGSSLTCQAKGAGGAECNLAKHCLSGRCNRQNRQCEPQRGQQEPCASDQQCANDLWCNSVFAARLCSVPLQLGEAGDSCNSQAPCGTGLECVQGSCRAPLTDGALCGMSAQCNAQAHCSQQTSTCTSPRRGTGESCSSSRDCLPELYCQGTCRLRVAAGESCSNSVVCAVGTRCDPVSRVCEPLLNAGQACGSADDCSPGLICEQFAGQCDGRLAAAANCDQSAACPVTQYCGPAEATRICRALVTASEGQSCSSAAVRCASGLFCDSSGRCRALGQADDPCRAPEQCAAGLYCASLSTCRPYASSGETCSTSISGSDPICGPNLNCTYDSNIPGYACVALPVAGESCLSLPCASAFYCSPASECVARLAAGGDCTSGYMCRAGLVCDPETDKCTARQGENEPCEQADDCADGLRCHSYAGKCTDRTAETEACNRSDECAAGLECELESRCIALAQLNERCDEDRPCAEGLRCDSEWGVCVALNGPFAVGEQCLVDEECTSGMCVNHVCTGVCQGVGR